MNTPNHQNKEAINPMFNEKIIIKPKRIVREQPKRKPRVDKKHDIN